VAGDRGYPLTLECGIVEPEERSGMADTEETVELDLEQREQADGDTEAAGERRAVRARERADERPAGGLAPEEEADRREREDEQARADEEEEVEHARAEDLELAANDEQELAKSRRDDALRDANRAIELASVDEVTRDQYRRIAAGEQRQALRDGAHGNDQLDQAAAHPEAPGADATAAAGRRSQRAGVIEDRRAEGDYRRADDYDRAATRQRSEGRKEQADAAGAVLNPPQEPPMAQEPQARRHVRKRAQKKNAPDKSSQPDLSLGD